jgi:hypothetical protein
VTAALSADECARLGQLQADPANIGVSTTDQDGATISIGVYADGVTLSLSIVNDPHAEMFVDWLDESNAFKTLERLEESRRGAPPAESDLGPRATFGISTRGPAKWVPCLTSAS